MKDESELPITPLPGSVVDESAANRLTGKLKSVFRDRSPDIANIVPTACVLKNARERKEILESDQFLGISEVYFYLENSAVLRIAKPWDVAEYIVNKEPWEYSDICIFDHSMRWCIGVTHNNHILYSEG